jgi:hypothetical protein
MKITITTKLRESLGRSSILTFRVCYRYHCLATAAKHPSAVMNYVNYETEVVLRYGVVLEGWPEGIEFACPSKLGNNVGVLTRLKDAVVSSTCKFRSLSATEKRKYQERYDAQVTSGEVIPSVRKTRKDAGRKRSREVISDSEVDADEEEHDTSNTPVTGSTGASGFDISITDTNLIGADPEDVIDSSFRVSRSATPTINSDITTPTAPPVPIAAPRFAALHGEILRDPNGRRIFSATPPVELPVGKRARIAKKVVHLGFNSM